MSNNIFVTISVIVCIASESAVAHKALRLENNIHVQNIQTCVEINDPNNVTESLEQLYVVNATATTTTTTTTTNPNTKKCLYERCVDLCGLIYNSSIVDEYLAMCVYREDFCQCAVPKEQRRLSIPPKPPMIMSRKHRTDAKCGKFTCSAYCMMKSFDFGICSDDGCICFEGLNHHHGYGMSRWYRLLEYEEIFNNDFVVAMTKTSNNFIQRRSKRV